MLSRRASIVETSVPSGRGITDIPIVINPRLTTLPMTKPTIAAKMFLTMGFMIKLVPLKVWLYLCNCETTDKSMKVCVRLCCITKRIATYVATGMPTQRLCVVLFRSVGPRVEVADGGINAAREATWVA